MAHRVPTKSQLQYIAHGVVANRDASVLAASTGLTVANVQRIVARKKLSPELLGIYDSYERNFLEQVNFSEVRHLQEMQDLTPDAYKVIGQALNDFEHDGNLAVTTAWKVLKNSGVDVHEDRASAGIEVNSQTIVFNEKSQQAIDVVSQSIAATTADMGFRLPPVGTPSKHRRISEAETVTQQRAVVSDAEIVPADAEENEFAPGP